MPTIKVPKGNNSTANTTKSAQVKKKMTGVQVFEKYNRAVFMVFANKGITMSQGSGFFVKPNIAVSNYHVFDGAGADDVRVKMADDNIYGVRVLYESERDDCVVFEVVGYRSKVWIPISVSKPKVGEKCYTIGSPLGLENTFSSGEISQLRDNNNIQITAPIDHGSSGGVLLNIYGEAIGITTAGIDESGANLNFAKSIGVVAKVIK